MIDIEDKAQRPGRLIFLGGDLPLAVSPRTVSKRGRIPTPCRARLGAKLSLLDRTDLLSENKVTRQTKKALDHLH